MFSSIQPPEEKKTFSVVGATPEFERIAAIPRRLLDLSSVPDVTPLFAKPSSGGFTLRPIQSAGLIEAAENSGLFAPIPVGGGKALLALLLPEAMDAKRAVIMTEPRLKCAMIRDGYEFYGRFLKIPWDRFTVIAYSQLSSVRGAGILEELQPDVLICDEAHCLKLASSARTKRFLRYAKSHPNCRFAFLSGTFTHRSPKDFAHLAELALRKNSPVPLGRELIAWCGALEVDPAFPVEPGVLRRFCRPGESIRTGFFRRLSETPGVVGDPSCSDVGASLIVRKIDVSIPKEVTDVIKGVERDWKIGDKEMSLALERTLALQQLASGFFYRWIWPNGKPDREWLDARAEYYSEARKKLQQARPGLDSQLLLARAAKRYLDWDRAGRKKEERPDLMWQSDHYEAWAEIRDRSKPKTETIWIHDFLIDESIKWAREHSDKGAILWYVFHAVGERLAAKGNFPLYGAGREAQLAKEPVIVCSVKAQGTGQNLQHRYSANLFTALRPNGVVFEQTVGRTHRPGQLSDEVVADWFGHTPEAVEAMDRIKEDAEYQQELMGTKQKVLYATHI